MNSDPYILLDENSWWNYLISILSLFYGFSIKIFIVYAYFNGYAATASKITDDVTKLVIEYLIPTYSTLVFLLRTFLTQKLDYLSLNKI